jgi:RHS repeat-associated protein
MGATAGLATTNYLYDAFNRKVSQTENAGTANAKTTTFDYLSTSDAVVGEEVNGTLTKSYQYSPWGERLDQDVHNTDGTEDPTYYSYDAHTNVQAITDSSGNTKATYGYSAYGSDDPSQDTGVDKSVPAGTDPYNSYRFNADRIDSSTGNYDMGFRNYDPGMNRFLSRDMYNGALSDLGMSADPYTGNRYAFGGGNPLSNIEQDGHDWISDHLGVPRFTVDGSGTATDNSNVAEVTKNMTSLRDWYVQATRVKGRTYVAGYDPVTQRYATGMSSNPFGCAERDVARKLGLPMDQVYFSKAVSYQRPSKIPGIDVCGNCQNDTEQGQFEPGTKGYEGGRWSTDRPIHTSASTELAVRPQTSTEVVPTKPSGSSGASDAAAAATDTSEGGGFLAGASTAFKWAGRGLMVLGIAADIYDVATAPDGQKVQTAVRDTSSLAGALAGGEVGAEAGAGIGAAIGSVVPGLGTAAGAAVGGIIGGIGGAIAGSSIGSDIGDAIDSLF